MSLPTNRMPGDIIQAVDINQIAEAVNQLSESGPSEPGGTTDHAALTNRDAADQHPIGSVTGLQSALNGKAATGHGHTIEDVEYLQIALNNKAEAGHGHPIADVTGLQTALNGKAATGHNHDDRYYTESEVNSALSGKANTSHSHPVTDLTATGTADDTTYLRGDGAWATPEGGGGGSAQYPQATIHDNRLSTDGGGIWSPLAWPGSETVSSSADAGILNIGPVSLPALKIMGFRTVVTTAGATGTIRFGLWSALANGLPDSLVYDSGDLDGTTTGTREVTPATPLELPAGVYWLGMACDASGISYEGWYNGATSTPYFGATGWTKARAARGAVLSPLPSSLSNITRKNWGSVNPPLIHVKAEVL